MYANSRLFHDNVRHLAYSFFDENKFKDWGMSEIDNTSAIPLWHRMGRRVLCEQPPEQSPEQPSEQPPEQPPEYPRKETPDAFVRTGTRF